VQVEEWPADLRFKMEVEVTPTRGYRGGSWKNPTVARRGAARAGSDPGTRYVDVRFRCAASARSPQGILTLTKHDLGRG